MEQPVLTRRSFLKATAVTGIAAALGGSAGLVNRKPGLQKLKQKRKLKL